jgi:hypothetical protein
MDFFLNLLKKLPRIPKKNCEIFEIVEEFNGILGGIRINLGITDQQKNSITSPL